MSSAASVNQSFSELQPFQTPFNNWREISLDIGASQSTLQDFKLVESSGFYCYKESDSWLSQTSNRFITWKISNDVVEFCEYCMDLNLVGNQVKLRFQNTPVLDGISVHETSNQVFILIATVASVHRLVLPHPRKLDNPFRIQQQRAKQAFRAKHLGGDGQEPFQKTSIFQEVSSDSLRDPDSYHVLSNLYNIGGSTYSSSAMPFPITSCSWLTSQKEAVFVVGNSVGSLMLIKMGSPGEPGKITSWELKQVRIMERLWNGLIPSFIRGNQEGEEAAASIVSHPNPTGDDYFIFVLCRDLRIRVWSYSKQDCIIVHNVLDSTCSNYLSINNTAGNTGNVKAQQSRTVRRTILRKAISQDGEDLYLGTYIGAVEHRLFVLYKLAYDEGRYTLETYATLTAPEEDIVDFSFTQNHIWTLWINAQSETSVRHCSIKDSEEWQTVPAHNHLPTVYPQSVLVDSRELYINDIFWKGKFSVQSIVKAISILSRIPESSFFDVKMHTLIEEATKIIGNQIRSQINSSELTTDEYAELELNCWEKFYFYCVQYNDVGNKPLGIMVDTKTSNVAILRKTCLSFLKSNDVYDKLLLSVYTDQEFDANDLTDEIPVAHNLNTVVKSLGRFSKNLTEEMLLAFEVEISSGEAPEKVAADVVSNYLIMATDVTTPNEEPLKRSFDNLFAKTPNFLDVLDVMIRALDIESRDLQDVDLRSPTVQVIPVLSQLMSSTLGVSVLCDTINQSCHLRYNFCRDLLLFQTFILEVRDKKGLSGEKVEKIRTHLIPMTAIYLQACYFMNWICSTPMRSVGAAAVGIDEIITQLSVLELNEYISMNLHQAEATKEGDFTPRSILWHFIQHNKCSAARRMVSVKFASMDIGSIESFSTVVPLFVQCIMQIIWPISSYFNLAEFLLGHAQYELVFQYCQLLDRWCTTNTYSRLFVKSFVHLALGDTRKAVTLFQQSLFGITEEPFFQKLIQGTEAAASEEESESLPNCNQLFAFYMKLIQLFKLNCHWEAVVELASQVSLLLSQQDDTSYEEHRSCLLSTMFTCHLELENIDQAYQCMMSNKNYMQRKDCLRQFIVTLSERRKIQELITYSYSDMEEEFVNILESRARASDLLRMNQDLNYYEILYSYFVDNNNYRKAAASAYEYARRLSHEVPGIESLTKQTNFLNAAFNCLKIVNPKYAWVVKPTLKPLPSAAFKSSELNASSSGKRKLEQKPEEEDSGLDLQSAVRKVIDVLGVEDIRKEYYLTSFRLKLLQKSPKENAIANSTLSAQETLTLLIGNSMFDNAFRLCLLFNIPLEAVFEGLVSKYVYFTQLVQTKLDESAAEIYDCFAENDTCADTYIAVADLKPVDKLWHLIFAYLKMYEKGQQTLLHRSVAEKLLISEINLPSSLKLSYQKRNCPELLRLLMAYDCIEEAVALATEYLEAYMGKGPEYFDIQAPIVPKCSPMYFPHQHYVCLLEILKTEASNVPEYKKMQKALSKSYDKFKLIAKQASVQS